MSRDDQEYNEWERFANYDLSLLRYMCPMCKAVCRLNARGIMVSTCHACGHAMWVSASLLYKEEELPQLIAKAVCQ